MTSTFTSGSSFVCLVCCNTWIHEDKDKSKSTNHESKIGSKIFDTFCENLNIKLEDSPYDFKSEALPFCPTCKEMGRFMYQLNSQLQSIQREMEHVKENVRARIDQSSTIFELEELALVVDRRFTKVRRFILEANVRERRNTLATADSSKSLSFSERFSDQRNNQSKQMRQSTLNGDTDRQFEDYSNSRVSSMQEEEEDDYDDDDLSNEISIKQENQSFKNGDEAVSEAEMEMGEQDVGGEEIDNSSDEDYRPPKGVERQYKKPKLAHRKEAQKVSTQSHNPSDSGSDSRSGSGTGNSHPRPARPVKRMVDGKFLYEGHKFSKVDDGFQCCGCENKTFKYRSGILVHIRHCHLGELSKYTCNFCGKVCDSPSAKKIHETTHSEEKNEVCTVCLKSNVHKSFKNKKYLRRHLADCHNIRINYNCDMCKQKCKNQEGLDTHIRKHHSGEKSSRYCDSCGQGFRKTKELQEHRDSSHKDQKFFQCFHCETNYLKKENFLKHLHEEHNIEIVIS